MRIQTIERINAKIQRNEACVRTEIDLLAAADPTPPDIVIVTFSCDLRGTSCMLLVPIAERGAFTRAKSITLDSVMAFPGPAPNERLGVVDTQLFAEQARDVAAAVAAGDILLKLLRNQPIRAVCTSIEGNVYDRSFRLEELEYARLISYNCALPARKFPAGGSNLMETLEVGSKIFVNGGLGVMIGPGTRHSEETPSLSFSVDIFGMRPPYVIGGAGAGSPLLTIGIPLAVTSEPVLVGIQAYVRELARTRYAHYPNEATLAEQIKSSIQSGDLRLTDSHYPVFTGGPPDRMRKD